MIHAIGDVHGQARELDRALARIAADGTGAPVVCLGDYTDRGPDSRAVLDRLVAECAAHPDWTFLLGNHDRMFARFLRSGRIADPAIASGKTWLHPRLDGAATLASYGIPVPAPDILERFGHDPALDERLDDLAAAARAAVPDVHMAFLDGLTLLHVTDAQIFVHAGIRPGLPLAEQVEDDMVWIREPFLSDPRDHGRLVVHGHTALDAPRHYGNRLNLDGGAAYGRPLTAALIDGGSAWALIDGERVPLLP